MLKETLSNVSSQLITLLKEAENFHGHFGPFLVIGVRAGLIGLTKLKVEKGDPKLSVTAMLKNSIPYSCIIDGVQVATGCTIGNKRLRLEGSSNISIRFKNNNGKQVAIEINSTALDLLIKQLSALNVYAEEVRRLGYTIASMNEHELFRVKSETGSGQGLLPSDSPKGEKLSKSIYSPCLLAYVTPV